MMNFVIGGTQVYPLEVNYNKSLAQLGASITASFPVPGVSVAVGDTVKIYEDWVSYFIGMVTEVTSTDKKLTLTAYDNCYYLNKSKRTMQFTEGMTVGQALTALWKECGIYNHYCPDMTAPIDAVFYAQSPADIAKKLITEEQDVNGGEYYIVSGGFNSVEVYKVGELKCNVALTAIMEPSKSVSLDSVKNRVSIIVTDGNGSTVTETASDGKSIAKYGLLQEFVTVSSDASGAVATAQNRLAQLKSLLADGSITVTGNWALTAVGQRIMVNEPLSGLSGEYVITAVSHRLGDDFQTTLSLKEYVEIPTFKAVVETADTEKLDAIGESRKATPTYTNKLILPYKSTKCRLTSGYGYRTHPVTGQKNSFHGGVDLVGITSGGIAGNIITAVIGGRVTQSRIVDKATDTTNTWQWGNYISILGDDGATIYYCHLASRLVQAGQTVRRGEVIGYEGSTGQVTGQHLHFEVRHGTESINAANYLGIPNEVGIYTGIQINSNEAAVNDLIGRLQ